MDNNKNKNLWIGLGVVAIVIIAILAWSFNKHDDATEGDNGNTPVVTDTNTPEVTPAEDTSAGSVNAGSGAATLSYANALIKYKNARLQIDPVCQASPDKMTFKNGASLMVDNRSSKDRVVKVGSVYNIKAWGFKIVKLSSSTLPTTWLVDCDSSQNVATVTIQK